MRALAVLFAITFAPFTADAEPLRIATFNTELSGDGPGLLLRDLERGDEPAIDAVIMAIVQLQPDVLALQGIDWDLNLRALKAFERRLSTAGVSFPYLFALRPNSGLASGLDLDGDGRTGGPGDSQGYGRFSGQGGLAVLSRLPILAAKARDLSPLLWQDMPGALLPVHPDGTPFPSQAAQAAQRLSSTGHWILPLELPGQRQLTLMTFQAGPPLFDGPEDRNGKRNHDEIRLWQLVMDGHFGPAPQPPFVIAGGANLDPETGEGRREAIQNLLSDPRLQDPRPKSEVAGENTVEWETAGQMRVDFLLPSADLTVTDTGVHWPDTSGSVGSRHRLVWVDILAEE